MITLRIKKIQIFTSYVKCQQQWTYPNQNSDFDAVSHFFTNQKNSCMCILVKEFYDIKSKMKQKILENFIWI